VFNIQLYLEITMKNSFIKAMSAVALLSVSAKAMAATAACCVAGAVCCVGGVMPCCL
jgi:hypothetical protein